MKRKSKVFISVVLVISLMFGFIPEPITSSFTAHAENADNGPNTAPVSEVTESGGWLYRVCADGYAQLMGYTDVSVETLTLPQVLDGLWVVRLSDDAFKDNTALTQVTIPTQIGEIPGTAFAALENLTISAYSGTAAMRLAIQRGFEWNNLSEYDFFEDVLDLSEVKSSQWSLSGTVMTLDAPYSLLVQSGDKLYLPPKGSYSNGVAVIVTAVDYAGEGITASVSALDFMETLRSYHAENLEIWVDYEHIQILHEGVTLDTSTNKGSISIGPISQSVGAELDIILFKNTEKEIKIKGNVKYTPEITVSVDYSFFTINSFEIVKKETTSTKAEFVYKNKNELVKGESSNIMLMNIPLVSNGLASVNIELSLDLSIEGTVTLKSEVVAKETFTWANGVENHEKTIERKAVDLSAAVEASLELKMGINVKIGFSGIGRLQAYIKIAELSGSIAIKAKASIKSSAPGCADIEVNLVRKVSIEFGLLKADIGGSGFVSDMVKKANFKLSFDIVKITVPIFKTHWEATTQSFTDHCLQINCFVAEFYYGVNNERHTQAVEQGEKLSSPPAVYNPGYHIDGWYQSEDFSGNAWNFASDTVENDITLYAHWAEGGNGSYEPGGGGGGGGWGDEDTPVSEFSYTENDNSITVTKYNGSRERVVIPRYIHGKPVVSIGARCFYNNRKVLSVLIPVGAVNIQDEAFYNCTNLTDITMPSGIVHIGIRAFLGCKSLQNATIPNSVTDIGDGAFSGCSKLISVSIPNGVISIGNEVFYNSGITQITIPNSVISIGDSAFAGCNKLVDISIPNNVISIGSRAFSDCASLADISIPNSVTNLGIFIFLRCNNLVHASLPDSITSIPEGTFCGCSSLQNVIIPNNVKSIEDQAFEGCSNLTSIIIPDSVTYIGGYAFQYCDNLCYVEIPNSVTYIDHHAFWCCLSLSSVAIPSSITSIEQGVFGGCDNLNSVTIPDSVKTIGWGAFWHCPSLSSITIPNSVTEILGVAFRECSSLTSIEIPSSVTRIDQYAFCECSSLASITIPDTVVRFESHIFDDCAQLTIAYVDSLEGIPATYLAENYSNIQLIVREPQTKQVQFNPMGGTMEEMVVTVNAGKLLSKPQAPTKEGYNFTGWYVDTACQTGWDFNTPVTENLVLYAGWEPAVNDFIYTVSQGKATITAYTGSDASLIIPETVNGLPVAGLAEGAIPSGVVTVTLPAAMTNVDARAFRYASTLMAIYTAAGNSVYASRDGVLYRGDTLACYPAMHGTSVYSVPEGTAAIGDYAFCGVPSLYQLAVPAGVKALGAFSIYDCANLYQVSFAVDVESIGNGNFLNCITGLNITGPINAQTLTGYADETQVNYNLFTAYYVQDGEIIGNIAVRAGTAVPLPVPEQKTEKAFWGWSTQENGNVYWQSGETMPANDLILYAVYGYDFEYASVSGGVQLTRYRGSASQICVPESIDGMAVVSISTNCFPNKNVTLTGNKGSVTESFANAQGIAFTPLTYTLHLEANGGTPVADRQLCATDALNLPVSVRTGYVQTGWCQDITLTTLWMDAAMPAHDLTLYAAWVQVDENAPVVPFTFEQVNGSLAITGYTGSAASTEIPASINGLPVVAIGNYAFTGNSILRSITLPSSVKTIGDHAFDGSLITSFTSAGVESIGAYAFADCAALNNVSLPNSLTALGAYAFQNCGALRAFTLPNNIATLPEGVFSGCEWLSAVSLPATLETIDSGAFRDCRRLVSVTIGSAVSEIAADAFDGCLALARIDVASGNMYYKAVDGVLFNRSGTQLLLYPQGKATASYTVPDSVTVIADDAMRSGKFSTLSLGRNVSSIGKSALSGCLSLSQINFNNALTVISARAFENCPQLKTVTLPGSVTRVGEETFDMSGLTSITVPVNTELSKNAIPENDGLIIYGKRGSDAELYAQVHGIRFIDQSGDVPVTGISITGSLTIAAGKSAQIAATLTPSNTTETTVIWSSSDERIAVVNAEGLVEAHATGTATIIATAANGAMSECSVEVIAETGNEFGIEYVISLNPDTTIALRENAGNSSRVIKILPGGTTVTMLDKGDSWSYVNVNGVVGWIQSIYLKKKTNKIVSSGTLGDNLTWTLDTTGLLTISGVGEMMDCDGSIAAHPFYAIRSDVHAVAIENGVTSIGANAFMGMSHLASVEIAESVTSILQFAFEDCEQLTDIALPDAVTYIGWYAFYECTALTSINIPANIREIDDGAFTECSNLKHLTLPDGIPTKEFVRCYDGNACDLYSYTLPASLEMLGRLAFARTEAGELLLHVSPDFVLPRSLQTIEAEAFSGINATCVLIDSPMTIESRAFADCKQLKYVVFADYGAWGYDVILADDAFDGCTNLIIFATPGYSNGAVEQFATDHGFQYYVIEGYYGNG